MNNKLLLLCFALMGFSLLATAQEAAVYQPTPAYPQFFKYVPQVDATTPEWAKLMYADDPNVREVEIAYAAYYRENPLEKSIHTQNYKHWRRTLSQQKLVTQTGFVRVPTEAERLSGLGKHLTQWGVANNQPGKSAGNWTSIGPFDTKNNGMFVSDQVNVYSLDQSQTNPNVLFAGTETGVIFKSTDKAENWTSVSDGLVLDGGVTAIEIDPTTENTVYFGHKDNIYKSTNGGTSWSIVHTVFGLTPHDISINPGNTQIVMVASDKGLYRSADGGDTWTQLYTTTCYDIDIKPGASNVVYMVKNNATPGAERTEFFKSTDSGANFTLKDAGWYVAKPTSTARGARIAVTQATGGEAYVYVGLLGDDVSYAQDINWLGVWKSTDSGENWTLPIANGDVGGPYSATHLAPSVSDPYNPVAYDQGFYNFSIEVSDTDKESLLVGCIRLLKSTDGAGSYVRINPGNGQHSDIQEMVINGNDVWVASDGGINKYAVDFSTQVAKSKGMNGTEYWGFGSGWNEDLLFGGRYHNGDAASSETFPFGSSLILFGGEERNGYVKQGGDERVVYTSSGNNFTGSAKKVPTSIDGFVSDHTPRLGLLPNQPASGDNENRSELVTDPRCYNHFYIGRDNQLMKSTDAGENFATLASFGSNGGHKVTGIEVSRQDPNVIYVVQRVSGSSKLWKSTNGGVAFVEVAIMDAGASSGGMWLTIDDQNHNNVWLAYNVDGSSANKVYRSSNGGTSWTNITTAALAGHAIEDIHSQGGTNAGVYLGTNLGMFYRNDGHADWQAFSTGMPARLHTNIIHPFYRDGKIRTGTYNRGIWESPFFEPSAPIAQPTVDKLSTACAVEIFKFDSYSIVNESGATYLWSFSPMPQSVSNLNVRNPEVVFGSSGTYTASLTVNGSSTKSITIEVGSSCTAEEFAGNALSLSGSNANYATVPSLEIGSPSTYTMSAWIKRNGDQSALAGIFNFDGFEDRGIVITAGNKLGYNPNPDFDSGLIIPNNEWTHVALVIEPEQATLYMNGIGVTDIPFEEISSTFLDFPSELGLYNGSAFKGLIDEVCFYEKAMTQTELRELMHLTKKPVEDPSLKAYYQFNEVDGIIYDKARQKNATLNGVATRAISTGPFGGGTSQTLAVTAGGIQAFTVADCEITFPIAGTFPNGDLVVSRINNAPDQQPGANPLTAATYWIVNNFGTNPTFSALESIKFFGLSGVSSPSSKYSLYKRGSNADGNTWGTKIDEADAVTASSVTFSTNNGITSFSQFAINQEAAILPVELIAFDAEASGQKEVLVTWVTAREVNNDLYSVEWGINGTSFVGIGDVASQGGNATEIQRYQFVHQQPATGVNYYRLRQNDLDGTFTYSGIRQVNFKPANNVFVLYPNPLRAGDQITVRTNSNEAYKLTVYDANGRLVHFSKQEAGVDVVNLSKLTGGFYSYQIETLSSLHTGKLVIE